jgi:hypothetical protein
VTSNANWTARFNSEYAPSSRRIAIQISDCQAELSNKSKHRHALATVER